MQIDVHFNIKKYRTDWSNQIIRTSIDGVDVNLDINDEKCHILLASAESEIWDIFYGVWEILALYDGYFYTPISAMVDGTPFDIERLYGMKFRKTDSFWRTGATLLAENNRLIDDKVVKNYMLFRNQGRAQGGMIASIINAYFSLLSVSYSEINIEHKLSLMLNICDGYFLNEVGNSRGTGGHILNIIGNLDRSKVQYGLSLMGIPKNKITELFGDVRDEIDHYVLKPFSAGSYSQVLPQKVGCILNTYLLYIAELSMRVTLLGKINGTIETRAKERAIDGINDWMILKSELSVMCKLPENQMKQDYQKIIRSISKK